MKVAPEITRISSLQQYLKTGQPDVVLSALTYANLLLIWAKQMSRSSVPVVVSERIALSTFCAAPDNAADGAGATCRTSFSGPILALTL
ncbi:MAG: hypothetical protein IPG06_25475 [Haliea sp.]|nr:hypothetical protein [Haliea sp.]